MSQNFTNHARYFPLFHFVASPIFLLNVLLTGWWLYREPSLITAWAFVMAIGLEALLLASRTMALRVQDRLIRLEESLRLARVLPPEMQGAITALRPRHFVALRFAPDEEVTELVRRVLAGELDDQKSIKMAIRNWKADTFRA
ncbi:MAG TPA: DUF6526 family protein [Gemmatimonadales bacterium]